MELATMCAGFVTLALLAFTFFFFKERRTSAVSEVVVDKPPAPVSVKRKPYDAMVLASTAKRATSPVAATAQTGPSSTGKPGAAAPSPEQQQQQARRAALEAQRAAAAAALPPEDRSKLQLPDVEFSLTDPDLSEYNALELVKPEPGTAKHAKWHKKACNALLKRARSDLKQFHGVQLKLGKYVTQQKQAGRLPQHVSQDKAVKDGEEALKKLNAWMTKVMTAAGELKPGRPGWDAGIFQEVTDQLRAEFLAEKAKQSVAKSSKKPMASSTSVDVLFPTRFKVGQRVACAMGGRFLMGHVTGDWRLPYNVTLDNGQRVFAPYDHDRIIVAYQPDPKNKEAMAHEASIETHMPKDFKKLWVPYRFGLGERVEVFGEGDWSLGTVVAHNFRMDDWPPGRAAAYQVRLEGSSNDLVFIVQDLDKHVRLPSTSSST